MKFVLKLRELFRILLFIQKRFITRYNTREAKLEILDNCWNKLCGQLNEENVGKSKSKFMSDMIYKIQCMKPVVKRAALEEYLRCAQRVHTIAFLQWRLKFPTPLRWHHKMLIDLVNERIEFMYGLFKKKKTLENMPNSTYSF